MILRKIKNIFKGEKTPKDIFPTSQYIIEEAFEVAGKKYYHFADSYSIPVERAYTAMYIYEECAAGITREYITKHTEVMDNLLRPIDGKTIDIYKINQLNLMLKEKLSLPFNADMLYKLASVVYFDENENPAIYEPEYANKKIEFWKANKGVADFFLMKPLQALNPFLRSAGNDLGDYFQLTEEITKLHEEALSMLG